MLNCFKYFLFISLLSPPHPCDSAIFNFFLGGGGGEGGKGEGRKVQLMNEVGGVLWECTMFETFFAYHKDFLACKIFILLILIL